MSQPLDKNTVLHIADIVQGLVRTGNAGEIEETLRRLAMALPTMDDIPLKAWGPDVPLRGAGVPKNEGSIKHLIEYLLTVYDRFGNTMVREDITLQWGSNALHKRDEQREQILALEVDARRWRALFSCSRIRVLGYARGGPKGNEGPIRHIGFEWTTDQAPYCDTELTDGKDRLIEFTDAILAKGGS